MTKTRSAIVLNIFTLIAFLALMVGSAVTFTPAYAAGIVVNSNADTIANNGSCTLREAITSANTDTTSGAALGECAAGSGSDTITFDANYTITLTSQLPAVTTTIVINGTGATDTIIQANAITDTATYRVFEVTNNLGEGKLSLDGLTVRNGRCNTSCATNNSLGGGILNAGSLTITNSTISGNTTSLQGGGIANLNAGTLTITNSTVFGNSATESNAAGGGVVNYGTLIITNSIFSENYSLSGGGISHVTGSLTVTNSTFAGNDAIDGGGIYTQNNASSTVTNSTFSGNYALSDGSGIAHFSSDTFTLNNSILADSLNDGEDCYKSGGSVNGSHNLIELDGSGGNACGTTAPINSDPSLAPLANNGGPTQTFALLPGSPAIDAGDNTICDASPGPNNLDQRGLPRPQGITCDIGALESNVQAGPTFEVNTNEDSADGSCDEYVVGLTDCTLRDAITYGNSVSGTDTINFAANYIITLSSQLPAVTDTVIITGNGAANTIIQANAASNTATYRVFQITSSGDLTLNSLTVRNGRCNGSCPVYSGNQGGGIFTQGDLTINNSVISENTAYSGGGLFNDVTGTVNINGSTFVGNAAADSAGGISNDNNMIITNSTITDNTATSGIAGGIINYSGLTIYNSTISGNTSNSAIYDGANIYQGAINAELNLYNTIIANGVNDGDCGVEFGTVSATNSLIEDSATACGLNNGVNGNIIGSDPSLGSLTGSPGYFPLDTDSPALNAGTNIQCSATDQRGVMRPQNGGCDIGAFESNMQPGPTFVVNTNEDSTDGSCDAYQADITDCTLREAIIYGNSISGADTINFASNYTITLSSSLPDNTNELTIDGQSYNIILDGADTYRILETGANLHLKNLTVQNGNNTNGGALLTHHTTTIANVTFADNTSDTGGAIYSLAPLDVQGSTFVGNSVSGAGGAIKNEDGTLTLSNSTFASNTAVLGGAVFASGNATTTIKNSTFSDNSAAGGGAAIFNNTPAVLNYANTILANSISSGDCENAGTLGININNLVEDGTCSASLSGDPNLGSLANNGGPTQTFALLPSSPAINTGDDTVCATAPVSNTSQNGVTRPQESHCDIGAFEKPDTTAPTVSSSIRVDTDPTALASVHFTVTFSESVTGVDTADFSLTTSGAVTNATVGDVTGSGTTYTVTVNTGNGNGTIRLDVLNDGTIKDTALNLLSSAFTSGEIYTVNKAIKTVSSLGTNDGWILESTETSGAGGTLNSTATNFFLGDGLADKQYRAILHFDTSSLPNTAVITSATLKIRKQGQSGSNPFAILGNLRVDMRKPAFGTAALALTDFKSTAGKNNVSTFGAIPAGNWYSAALNSTGNAYINRIGTTQFRLYFTTDDNNDNGNDFMKFYSGNAGAANRPQLVIEYYLP